MNKEYISISELNRIIKYTIDSNDCLRNIYIKGEISNLKYHSRGHLYFSLKDENSKINAVMFNYKYSLKDYEPKDGDSVIVFGRVSVYEATGSYQIYAESMKLDGKGNLYLLFEQLKKKLSSEGLFSEDHKKSIVKLPKNIGVVTAPTGAAIKDIISTINKRYPLVNIYVFASLVQGENAKDDICHMINLANTFDIDTLIVGRGGGAIEDLWPFNEEDVARAIYNSKIPVISGVGHEIDFTISDFVADKRAPTPTGAAIVATPDKYEILRYLSSARERINISIHNKLNNYMDLLSKYKTNYILNNPVSLYEMKEQKIDLIYDKLNNLIRNKLVILGESINKYKTNYLLNNPNKLIENKNNILLNLKVKLDLLNPINILDKGYSIVYCDNKVVKNIGDVNINDNINIMVKNGSITAKVKGVNNK